MHPSGVRNPALEVALDIAGEFPDGAFFIDLAPITAPTLVEYDRSRGQGTTLPEWKIVGTVPWNQADSRPEVLS
jgi:hypothetical protein